MGTSPTPALSCLSQSPSLPGPSHLPIPNPEAGGSWPPQGPPQACPPARATPQPLAPSSLGGFFQVSDG